MWRAVHTGAAMLLAALTTSALIPTPAAPAAAGEGGVRVLVNGRSGLYLSLAAMRGAVDVPRNTPSISRTVSDVVNDRPGSVENHGGVSVRALLLLAGIDPGHVTSLSLRRIGGGNVELTADEIGNGFTGDPQGLREATFDPDYGPEVHFFRPLRDAADTNDEDRVDAPRGQDLVAEVVLDGELLNVRASCDPCASDKAAVIGLKATTQGSADDAQFEYHWEFGDGSFAGGAQVAHRFEPGTWRVNVVVIGRDGASGADTVDVTIGTPPTQETESAGDGPGRGGSTVGGGKGAPDAPAHGPRSSRGRGRPGARSGSSSPAVKASRASRGNARQPAGRRRMERSGGTTGRRVEGLLISAPGEELNRPQGASAPEDAAAAAARRAAVGGDRPLLWLLAALTGAVIFSGGGIGQTRTRQTRVSGELRE